MMNDIENKPNCLNWASGVKLFLSTLGFYEVWKNQGVGNKDGFYVFLNKDYQIIFPRMDQQTCIILKLKELMPTTNKRILSNLSLYIFKAFKIRYAQ